ncbi:MAG: NAD(P)-dependent oxidoreductase [Saprospiraceae bacterium]|nr:NAD(P)-dependent oxidoreductase [Saprospiraceae bacterium]
MKKILVTGGTGDVGTSLCGVLKGLGYDDCSSSRRQPENWDYPHHVFDITDMEAFKKALEGVTVLIHLAGQREPGAGFDELIGPNIRGAYTAFEAAKEVGVSRVIFASSVNVSNGELLEDPVSEEVINPSSLYGCSKVFGESLARFYSQAYNMVCFCLRMGWTLPLADSAKMLADPPMDPKMAKRLYLSVEDFTQMVHLLMEAPDDLKFGVFNVLSDNREKILDISKARSVLGYSPKHDAFELIETMIRTT